MAEAVESALCQTVAPREVIVVDDASTDGTAGVLARFGSRITVVCQPRNCGVSTARNLGASLASGRFLAFLDADDQWMPAKLEGQLQRLAADPDLGLVHCGVEDIDADGRRIGTRTDGAEGWISTDLLLFKGVAILGGGSGALMERSVFEESGGFDPGMSTSADWDLYYRIACLHRVAFVPEILIRYRLHGSNMHSNVDLMERDMRHAFAKAFAAAEAPTASIRRRAYANLHAALAGSYFVAGRGGQFCRHAALALTRDPRVLPRFLLFPLRRLRRAVGTA